MDRLHLVSKNRVHRSARSTGLTPTQREFLQRKLDRLNPADQAAFIEALTEGRATSLDDMTYPQANHVMKMLAQYGHTDEPVQPR